jgi:peptidoglycan/LPS O-acetylase OafA/YrhL
VSRGAFREDIQGLRAIAVLLVLVYHLWPDVLSGGFVGVDVFFVISGFLITAHLLQHPPTSTADLLEFWGRRIRRILPAAFLVLAVTAIGSRMFAPETRWAANAGEIIASALYVQNWVLAGNAVDYLAAAQAPTPVQHYWSLAVEEQFYLVWPIVILAAFWFVRHSRASASIVTSLAMLAVIGVSLAVSISATSTDPASAYFITPTRVWELAVGGFVATLPSLGSLRLPDRLRDGVAWIGTAMVLAAGLTFTGGTPFPGDAALLPVVGTGLVILAEAAGVSSPTRFLRNRPIQHLGDTSYSIYLWHWPLIVLWPDAVGAITPVSAVVIVALTIGLASLSKVYVEDRFRFAPSFQALKPTFRFAAVGMVVLSVLGSAQLIEAQLRIDAAMASARDPAGEEPWNDVDDWPAEPSGAASSPIAFAPDATNGPSPSTAPGSPSPSADPTAGSHSCRGAAAIVRGFDVCPQDPASPMVPDPLVAASDWSDAYRDGCWTYLPSSTHAVCRYGRGDIRIALVGNSHAGQWLPTLQVLATRRGWTITTFLASRCNVTDATLELYGAAQSCLEFGRWVMDQTRGPAFDLVITSERQSVTTRGDTWSTTRDSALVGYSSYLKRWSKAGTNVLILRDTPFPGRTLDSVPDCLAKHRTNQAACSGTPDGWRWMDPLFDAATDLGLPGITTLDTTRFLCTATDCPAVIGSVVTYFDASHMTETYARSVARFIEADILAALRKSSVP